MSKRILIFSVAYEPHIGGAELAVRYITDRLLSYEFDLITARLSQNDLKQEKIGNVNVYRVGFGGMLGKYLYPFFASRLAKKLHRKSKYHLVWSIMAAYAGAASLLFLNKWLKIPLLLTLQEGDSIDHIHGKVRRFKSAWREIFTRASYIQAISKYLADWARKEGAVCPVEVVPNGVNLEKFTPSNRQSPAANRFTIITTSRLVHKNGVDILIEAAARLKTMIPDSGFMIQILGSGPEEAKLKKLAKDLNVEDVVKFLGFIDNNELPKYLEGADIFVRASRSEGLGISFLEAMASGLPIIATKAGGIPDFLSDDQTGLFTKSEDPSDLAEKIKKLIENDDLRERLSQNGRELVEKEYDWDIIAGRMDKIFQKL